jgi:epoxyqueuosine reductase QueG
MPLLSDRPIDFGVWDFCLKCEKCADKCPSKSIAYGEPTEKPNNISNREGLLRWPINAETCLAFWAKNGTDCANCIRSCPFNKPSGRLHDMVRWGISNAPWLNTMFLWGDEIFGYGKKGNPDRFWTE